MEQHLNRFLDILASEKGYADNTIVPNGMLDDNGQFIGKPYSMEELRRKVRQVLDG